MSENEVSRESISWASTVFMISNAALGAGLLNFPYAYGEAGGVTVSLLLQTLLLIPACFSLVTLGYYSRKYKTTSFEDTIGTVCGSKIKIAFILCLLTYIFFCCITYLIIIGDQFDQVVVYVSKFIKSDKTWYNSRSFLITISSTLIILPLCMLKDIGFLRFSSVIGLLSIIFIVFFVLIGYYVFPLNPGPIKTFPDKFSDIFFVIPTICFGYQAHVSVVPIMSSMEKKDEIKSYGSAALAAILICMFAYSCTGVFGYWSFGGDILPDIIDNYTPNVALIIGTALIGLKMMTTYPVLAFCGRNDRYGKLENSQAFYYCFTLSWFVMTVIFSIFIPNITIVISFLGGLAAIFSYSGPGLLIYCDCMSLMKLSQGVINTQMDDEEILLPSDENVQEFQPLLNKNFYLKLTAGILLISFGMFAWGLNTAQTVERIFY